MGENILKYFDKNKGQILLNFIEREFDYKILSKRLRLLSFISACQAVGDFQTLKGAFKWALDSGVDAVEIYEVLLQGHLFIGYPKALESFFVYNEVLVGSGSTIPADAIYENWDHKCFKSRGLETARKVYSDNLDLVLRNIDRLAPDLASGMINEGYGRIISRPGLDLVARELAIVSMLTVSDMPRQLYSHVRGASNVGAKKRQIRAVINQCSFHVADKTIIKALSILEKSLGNSVHPR